MTTTPTSRPPAAEDRQQPPLQDGRLPLPRDTSPTTDASLARRAANGDSRAWDEIFAAYHPYVFRYIRARTGDGEAADLAADVFAAAVDAIGNYRGNRPLLAWLYGIARHRVADHHRKAKRREPFIARLPGFGRLAPRSEDQTDFIPEAVRRDADPAFVGDRLDLQWALSKLTEVQREVITLRYFAGFRTEEIAAALGREPAAVYSLEARALARLRREIGQ
jgi:RNA polymerase sigma factor (sigma-70 family)